jgi:uncharacterized protein YutE (UPF0331/DUF86 family)
MIDTKLVCGKLAQLRERQQTLAQLAAEPRAQFLADPVKLGAAERLLQVSIEICLDVGHHLIAGLGLPRPAEYRDVFRILGERGLLGSDFTARLEKMAAFRNRLVHVYAEVDPEQVYQFLQKDRADFDEFARVIASFIKQQVSKQGPGAGA